MKNNNLFFTPLLLSSCVGAVLPPTLSPDEKEKFQTHFNTLLVSGAPYNPRTRRKEIPFSLAALSLEGSISAEASVFSLPDGGLKCSLTGTWIYKDFTFKVTDESNNHCVPFSAPMIFYVGWGSTSFETLSPLLPTILTFLHGYFSVPHHSRFFFETRDHHVKHYFLSHPDYDVKDFESGFNPVFKMGFSDTPGFLVTGRKTAVR